MPKLLPLIVLCAVLLQGCVVSMAASAVEAAADVAITAVKIPVKVGVAAVDVATGGDDDEESGK